MSKYILILFLLVAVNTIAQTLGDPKAIVYSLDIHPDNKFLVALVGARKKVEVWNYQTQQLVKSLQLNSVGDAVANSGSMIVVAVDGGVVELYDTIYFEKIAEKKTGDGIRIVAIKSISTGGFILVDIKGNVFLSTTDEATITFVKLFTSSEPITGIHVIPERNIVLTGHANGKLSIWSLSEGALIKQQQFGSYNNVGITSDSKDLILATFDNGIVEYYKINEDNTLMPFSKFKTGHVPMSLDYINQVAVVGTTGGLIKIRTLIGEYKTKVGAMINFVRIIPSGTLQIKIVAGTHGNGIKIIEARNMKLHSL